MKKYSMTSLMLIIKKYELQDHLQWRLFRLPWLKLWMMWAKKKVQVMSLLSVQVRRCGRPNGGRNFYEPVLEQRTGSVLNSQEWKLSREQDGFRPKARQRKRILKKYLFPLDL